MPPALQKTLHKEIEKIRHHLLNCCFLKESDSENIHQYMRDNFAEIAKIAKSSKNMGRVELLSPVSNKSRNESRMPEGKLDQLAHFFDDFHKLTKEVKRYHYDRAAQLRLDTYAEEEFDNLLALEPALALQRKGSELVITKEYIASVLVGIEESKIAIVGGVLSYTYTTLTRMYNDLDGDALALKTGSHGIGTGIIARFGSLFHDHDKKAQAAGIQLLGKVTYTTGDYIDYKNWKDYFKAEVIHDSGKRLHFRQSGKADTAATKFKQSAYRKMDYVFGGLLGVKHLRNSAMPRINQKKREKGMNNSDRMIAASIKLQTRLPGIPIANGNFNISDIVKAAYPRISDSLSKTGIGVNSENRFGRSDLELDEKIYSSNSDLVPPPTPGTIKKRGTRGIGALQRWEGNFSVDVSGDLMNGMDAAKGRMRLGGKISIEVNCAEQKIGFLRLKSMHEQLDPGYNQDVEKSESLLSELYSPETGLHFSNALKPKTADDLPRNGAGFDLKFENQFDSLDDLRDMYIDFAELSSSVKSFANKNYREANAQSFNDLTQSKDGQEQGFKIKRDCLIEKIFGINTKQIKRSPAQQKFYEKLVGDPEFFMVKAYDALSTRLGYIGVNIYRGKEWMHTHPVAAGTADSTARKRRTIDLMYQSLRNLMDGVFLPIDRETLLRGASIRATSASVSSLRTVTGQLRANVDMNPMKAIPGQETNPTALVRGEHMDQHENGEVKVWIPGGALGVGVKGSYLRMYAHEHANPARQGLNQHLKISGTAEGLTPLAIKGLTEMGLGLRKHVKRLDENKNVRAQLGLDENNPANAERMEHNVHMAEYKNEGFIEDSILLAKRTALTEYTGEFEMFVSRKAPPSSDRFEYEITQQFIRFLSRDTQRAGMTLGAPLHYTGLPVTPSIAAHRTTADGNVLFETLGKNLSYQLLSFNELQSVLDKSIKEDLTKNDSSMTKLDPTKIDEQCDFEKMQRLFMNKVDKNSESVDGIFKLHKFFGTDDSILGFVKDFDKSCGGRRDIGKHTDHAVRGDNNKDLRSEFDYYDDRPDYWDTINKMATAAKYAPGTKLGRSADAAKEASAFDEAVSGDPRPAKMSTEDKELLVKVGAHFATGDGKNATSEQRMKYYMTNPDGKAFFQIYCNIVSKYDKINEALKARNTYESKVVVNNK